MSIQIKIIAENKKDFLDLLLLADEQESMIDRYLEHGEMFALYDGSLKSICVITRENADTCEVKNLATYPLIALAIFSSNRSPCIHTNAS